MFIVLTAFPFFHAQGSHHERLPRVFRETQPYDAQEDRVCALRVSGVPQMCGEISCREYNPAQMHIM